MRQSPKKDVMERVITVIRSCKTLDHLVMAKRMSFNFLITYGDDLKTEMIKEWTGLPVTGKIYDTLVDTIKDQRDRINHLSKFNKTKLSL